VATAVAGRDRVRLQPSGAYAANLLGLSEQVPAKVVFLTDGPSRVVLELFGLVSIIDDQVFGDLTSCRDSAAGARLPPNRRVPHLSAFRRLTNRVPRGEIWIKPPGVSLP